MEQCQDQVSAEDANIVFAGTVQYKKIESKTVRFNMLHIMSMAE